MIWHSCLLVCAWCIQGRFRASRVAPPRDFQTTQALTDSVESEGIKNRYWGSFCILNSYVFKNSSHRTKKHKDELSNSKTVAFENSDSGKKITETKLGQTLRTWRSLRWNRGWRSRPKVFIACVELSAHKPLQTSSTGNAAHEKHYLMGLDCLASPEQGKFVSRADEHSRRSSWPSFWASNFLSLLSWKARLPPESLQTNKNEKVRPVRYDPFLMVVVRRASLIAKCGINPFTTTALSTGARLTITCCTVNLSHMARRRSTLFWWLSCLVDNLGIVKFDPSSEFLKLSLTNERYAGERCQVSTLFPGKVTSLRQIFFRVTLLLSFLFVNSLRMCKHASDPPLPFSLVLYSFCRSGLDMKKKNLESLLLRKISVNPAFQSN